MKNSRISRFFIDEALLPAQHLSLPPNLVNYIVNVLRLKTGDDIILFNNAQQSSEVTGSVAGEFSATLTEITKRSVTVVINHFIEKPNIESPLKIHLFQGISRSERMDLTIQKAVELGVDHFTPVLTQRSNSGKFDTKRLQKKLQHWQGIALSACEQSGRSRLVNISAPIPVQQLGEYKADISLLLAPDAELSLTGLAHLQPVRVNVFIGPEGGLSNAEIELAMSLGYQKIRLGPRILRTESAGFTVLSILQFLWGDLA